MSGRREGRRAGRRLLRRKAEAFDLLAAALVNCWADGHFSWWCRTPSGGPPRAIWADAVADLVEWARRTAPKVLAANERAAAANSPRVPLRLVEAPVPAPHAAVPVPARPPSRFGLPLAEVSQG